MSAATDETVDVNTEIEQDADDTPANLSDAGKAAIQKERDARRAAAKEARELKAENDALKAAQAEAAAAKAAADEAEAERKGEFERLATERAESLKTVTGERDGLKAQLDTLIASLKPGIDASFKELPEEVAELYTGDADDVLGKQAFMATHKKLIDRFAADKTKKDGAFRNVPKTPKPNGTGLNADADKARQAQSRTVSTI